MSATLTSLEFTPPEIPEDQARAGYYALLARLYYAKPDSGLLTAIGSAQAAAATGAQSALSGSWDALALAARVMDAEAAGIEHDQLFVGTGKAPITPYASFYLAQTGRENLLVRLRSDLAELGLARGAGSHEPEDHVAGLFDVMRHLISTGSEIAAAQQRHFFERYIEDCYRGFCAAISASDKSNFYKHVGRFTRAFLDVESEALKVF